MRRRLRDTGEKEDTYSQEEVIDAFYEFYTELKSKHEAYGIVSKVNLTIEGEYNSPGEDYIFCVSGEVSMTEEYTYEEFASMIQFDKSYYYPGMYNLEADCL